MCKSSVHHKCRMIPHNSPTHLRIHSVLIYVHDIVHINNSVAGCSELSEPHAVFASIVRPFRFVPCPIPADVLRSSAASSHWREVSRMRFSVQTLCNNSIVFIAKGCAALSPLSTVRSSGGHYSYRSPSTPDLARSPSAKPNGRMFLIGS